MTPEQAIRVNFNGNFANAAIKELVREGIAFKSGDEKYLLAYPWAKPYKQRIMALDVVLENIVNIRVRNIYMPTEEESKYMLMGFVKNQKAYEIFAAFNKHELDRLIEYLNKRWKAYSDENNMENLDNMRYLIIVKNESLLMYLPEKVDFKGAYAIVNNTGRSDAEVLFYNPYANMDDDEMKVTMDEDKLDDGVILIDDSEASWE